MTSATRTTPPAGVVLRYRLFGFRVPSQWLSWVEQDLARPGWLGRGHFWVAMAPVVVVALVSIVIDIARREIDVWSFTTLWLTMPLVLLFVILSPRLEGAAFYRRLNERILAYQRGRGPHPTFGVESPRSLFGVVLAAALISIMLIVVVRLAA